jgi:sulfotransferase
MPRKYFFLAGLPRSGSTLLASILNQNPNIYVSAESSLPNILSSVSDQYESKQNLDHDRSRDIKNILQNLIPLFYARNKEDFIIDKSFLWTEPGPYGLLEKHLENDIKIICTVRNPLETFASWHRISDMSHSPDEIASLFQQDFFNGVSNMKRIINDGKSDSIIIIEYNDIVDNIEKTIDDVYNFLEIKKFSHNFLNILNPHKYNDASGIKGQHLVKPQINKETYNLEEMFSSDTIKKYSDLEFWKE